MSVDNQSLMVSLEKAGYQQKRAEIIKPSPIFTGKGFTVIAIKAIACPLQSLRFGTVAKIGHSFVACRINPFVNNM